MSNITIEPHKLQGIITVPADKSISHRAIIISSLAQGQTRIRNLSFCADCLSTIEACKSLGISITADKDTSYVLGNGLQGLRRPKDTLYLGNSGTTMRLLSGVLSGQNFSCTLTADASLSRRPMKRIIAPLTQMGAKISGRKINGEEFAPLTIQGGKVFPIDYKMPIPSAQVKSAILLAGLYAEGQTKITEPFPSRDHTERMLKRFGAALSVEGQTISLKGTPQLTAQDIEVPGDISSASFFIVGACICNKSTVEIKSTGLNPTRTGFLDILKKMGANISWTQQNRQPVYNDKEEAAGTITAKSSKLQAVTISEEQVPGLIDELPILMVAATQAAGKTIIKNAAELRVKESDRISAMVSNLSRMGANICCIGNDIIINGPANLTGSRQIESFDDHRIAMSLIIAALTAKGNTTISGIDCIKISFPDFLETLSQLTQ